MDFTLSDVQRAWRDKGLALGRELSEEAPAGAVIAAAARAGLIDPRADLLAAAAAVDALAHESASAAFALALHTAVVLGAGSDERFTGLARGERVAAIALSSDEYPVLDADRLSGRATWVTPLADGGVAVVGAAGDGTGACAVSLDAPGVAIEPVSTAGLRQLVWGHLRFEAAPVVPLGPPMPYMARARVLLAAAGLGMGRRALDEALRAAHRYSRRGAGGEQTVQGLLADAATELDAAMLLTWKAASADALSLAEASMAKLAATEAAQGALLRATQVLGGESFRRGHIVKRLTQDVRALELFAGRTEALREAVAEEVLPRP